MTLLFLSSLTVLNGYFSFDLPSITSDDLKRMLVIDNAQYGLLFSVYALPNAILPMLSGMFFANLGKWKGVTLIAAVITIGIIIVWVGVNAQTYWLVLLGRVIYGLGGESVYVGIDILTTKWFQGAEMGLAYGLIQGMGQAGSFSAFYLGPVLADALGGTKSVYTVACALALTSVTCLGIARLLEKTARGKRGAHMPGAARAFPDAEIDMHHTKGVMLSRTGVLAAVIVDQADAQVAAARKLVDAERDENPDPGLPIPLTPAEAAAAAAALQAEEDEYEEVEEDEHLVETSGARAVREKCCTRRLGPFDRLLAAMGIYHLLALRWDFWCVLVGIACYSSAAYSLLAFGNDWLQVDHGYNDHTSGQALGIVSIFSMVVSPSIGLLMDRRGGQRYACFVAMLGLTCTFAALGFTTIHPIAGLVLIGIFYSICPSSLYPLLTETVPEESFVVVYAIVNAFINAILTGAYYLAGYITKGSLPDEVGALSMSPSLRHPILRAMLPRLAGAAVMSGRRLQDDPGHIGQAQEYKHVFTMFVTITGVGCIATFFLARDAFRRRGSGAYTTLGGTDRQIVG